MHLVLVGLTLLGTLVPLAAQAWVDCETTRYNSIIHVPEVVKAFRLARSPKTDELEKCQYTQIMSELVLAYDPEACIVFSEAHRRADTCQTKLHSSQLSPEEVYLVMQKVFYTTQALVLADLRTYVRACGGYPYFYDRDELSDIKVCPEITANKPSYVEYGWDVEPPVAAVRPLVHEASAVIKGNQ